MMQLTLAVRVARFSPTWNQLGGRSAAKNGVNMGAASGCECYPATHDIIPVANHQNFALVRIRHGNALAGPFIQTTGGCRRRRDEGTRCSFHGYRAREAGITIRRRRAAAYPAKDRARQYPQSDRHARQVD